MRAVVKHIYVELYQEGAWWWDPDHTPTDQEREARALFRANETGAIAQLYSLAADILTQAIELRDTARRIRSTFR